MGRVDRLGQRARRWWIVPMLGPTTVGFFDNELKQHTVASALLDIDVAWYADKMQSWIGY